MASIQQHENTLAEMSELYDEMAMRAATECDAGELHADTMSIVQLIVKDFDQIKASAQKLQMDSSLVEPKVYVFTNARPNRPAHRPSNRNPHGRHRAPVPQKPLRSLSSRQLMMKVGSICTLLLFIQSFMCRKTKVTT